MTALLPYLLINVKVIEWEKISLTACKILRLKFVNKHTLTANDKYSVLNRDNLMQSIQMHLSQKQKKFLHILMRSRNLH